MQYQHNPSTVTVVHWTGDNKDEMAAFVNGHLVGEIEPRAPFCIGSTKAHIDLVKVGDSVVREGDGSMYACNAAQLAFMFTKVDNPFAEQVSP